MANTLWTAKQAEQATGGKAIGMWKATGVSIDTRTLKQGDLFIAIRGEKMDGHQFITQALEKGAAAVVVDHRPDGVSDKAPLLIVEDTMEAMRQLGRASRERIKGKIIAVTGSVGKTSTKEMLKIALDSIGESFASEGNLNNHYGLPLSLSRMPKETQFGIFEMGMNHPGEITPLSELAHPDVAIISTVEAVHLEFFDSVEQIADAKAEIFQGMDKKGIAVLNHDNPYFGRLSGHAKALGIKKIISFGKHKDAMVRLVEYKESQGKGIILARLGDVDLQYCLGIAGEHQARNSVGVLAAIWAMGEDFIRAAKALESFTPQYGRGKTYEITRRSTSFTLIDDSYNASPASVEAAVETLANKASSGRKIVVLGDMFELGAQAPQLHAQLAKKLVENRVDLVFTAGKLTKHLNEALPEKLRGAHQETSTELAPYVARAIQDGDVVLVKGSRGMRMERVVEHLLQEEKQSNAV